jgi:hypothetical protein
VQAQPTSACCPPWSALQRVMIERLSYPDQWLPYRGHHLQVRLVKVRYADQHHHDRRDIVKIM